MGRGSSVKRAEKQARNSVPEVPESESVTLPSILDIIPGGPSSSDIISDAFDRERYRAIFESASDVIMVLDEKGMVTDVNQKMFELSGYSKDEIIGVNIKNFGFFMNSRNLARISSNFTLRMYGTELPPYEVEVINKAGKKLILEINARPLRKDKKIVGEMVFLRDITQWKNLEQGLRESETNLRTYLQDAPDGVFVFDSNGVVLFGNKESEKIIGYPLNELVGKKMLESKVLQHQDIPRVARLLEVAAQGKKITNEEFQLIRRDGSSIWVELNTTPTNQNGKRHIIVFIRDIAERKRTEAALQLEKEKAQMYLDNAAVIMLCIDANGSIGLINKKGCEILGQKEKDILDKNWFDTFIPSTYREETKREWFDKTNGTAHYFESPVIRKNGELRTVAWRNVRIKDRQGQTIAFLSSGEDITKNKETEHALRQIETLYRSMAEQSTEAIYISTREGKYIEVNDAMLKLFGYSRDEMLNMNAVDCYVNLDDRIKFQKEIEIKGFVKDYEVKFAKKNGTVMYCLLNSTLRIADDGSVLGYQGFIRDITEKKLSEEKLKASRELLEKTLDGAVNAIATMAELRDPYTAGHQRRVAKLATAIAQEMGFEKSRCETIRIAATLHDIGKMHIPAEILSKPGRLSVMEMNMIRTHPQVTREILKSLDLPWPICQIVLQHHERMNGTGYPNNLSGENISIEARILAVSDVVEAMASHRPYRPSLGIEKALAEIENNKGSLYDSTVVDICLKLFRENHFQFE
jgi:PAS domain S-box-containing protein/putative nucleotidyltransferase with HDIG domain